LAEEPFDIGSIHYMANVILVGTQWGDEGKGKLVDILTEFAHVIVRFQGGSNAGHTVVIGENQFIFHQLPSGILHEHKLCVIGSGVVLDPTTLVEEIAEVKENGFFKKDDSLVISEEAQIVMPYHKRIDLAREKKRGENKIGTTGRGIGPAYEDKIARTGIRLVDLVEEDTLRSKLQSVLDEKNFYLQNYLNEEPFDFQKIYDDYRALGDKLSRYIANTSFIVNQKIDEGKDVLFEGAQGGLLDVDHGTYPYVTSSNTVSGSACVGSGVGPNKMNRVLGVTKAYTTRVGSGPFTTELQDDMGDLLRKNGGEYGATTGRPRRCGWFDAVVVKHSLRLSGLTDLAITKLDVLGGLKKIKLCTAYKYRGKTINEFPSSSRMQEECEPVYEEVKGWDEDISMIKDVGDLPKNAYRYIKLIEQLVGVDACMISLGNERSQTMLLSNPFHDMP
jgi:adenylosuccinate synthase